MTTGRRECFALLGLHHALHWPLPLQWPRQTLSVRQVQKPSFSMRSRAARRGGGNARGCTASAQKAFSFACSSRMRCEIAVGGHVVAMTSVMTRLATRTNAGLGGGNAPGFMAGRRLPGTAAWDSQVPSERAPCASRHWGASVSDVLGTCAFVFFRHRFGAQKLALRHRHEPCMQAS